MNLIPTPLKFAIVLIFIALTIGCRKNLTCTDGTVSLNLINYTSQEIDTLIITTSEPGNSQPILNTRTLVKDQNMTHIVSGDTIRIQVSADFLSQSFDWQITIPSVNRTISITSIEGERRTIQVGTFTTDSFCENRIFSCLVDGVKITFPGQNDFQNNRIYVTK